VPAGQASSDLHVRTQLLLVIRAPPSRRAHQCRAAVRRQRRLPPLPQPATCAGRAAAGRRHRCGQTLGRGRGGLEGRQAWWAGHWQCHEQVRGRNQPPMPERAAAQHSAAPPTTYRNKRGLRVPEAPSRWGWQEASKRSTCKSAAYGDMSID